MVEKVKKNILVTLNTVRGGFWSCTTGFAEHRFRREGEETEERGFYDKPLHPEYNGLIKKCTLTCNHNWELVGSASAECHSVWDRYNKIDISNKDRLISRSFEKLFC